MNIEFAILDWIQEHLSCPLMDWLMVFFSRLGDSGLIWIIITIILLIPRKKMCIRDSFQRDLPEQDVPAR